MLKSLPFTIGMGKAIVVAELGEESRSCRWIRHSLREHDGGESPYAPLPIEHLVTSNDCQASKPRREMCDLAVQMLDLAPRKVLHVEASRSIDVVGAKHAGMAVAWINRLGKPCPVDPGPDFTVQDLYAVLDIIRPDTRRWGAD